MNIRPDQIDQILQGATIPPQPQILVDITMEQVMPSPDLNRVSELISQDASLSGSILKVINSQYFERSNAIHSVKQACQLLGLDNVIHIINGLSIKGEMSDESVVDMTKLWDYATDVALCSATVAKRIGFPIPEIAYNLGLFHDCGISLLYKKHPDYFATLEKGYSGHYARVIDAENETYNTNHAVVGYYIARSWRCPPVICDAIAEHHNVEKIFNDPLYQNYSPEKKTLLACLKMSETITASHKIFGNIDTSFEWEAIQDSLLDYVGLSSYDFEILTDQVKEMGIGL